MSGNVVKNNCEETWEPVNALNSCIQPFPNITDLPSNWSFKLCYKQHIFSTASPDPFTSVTRAQGEPALWKAKGAICRPASSGIPWQQPVWLHSARQWALKLPGHPHEVCFWLFDQRNSHQWPGHIVWIYSAEPVLSCTKKQIRVLLMVKDLLRPCAALLET